MENMSWKIARCIRDYYCGKGTEPGLESVHVWVWADGHVSIM